MNGSFVVAGGVTVRDAARERLKTSTIEWAAWPDQALRSPIGKGAALRWLGGRIRTAKVPEFITVPVAHWRSRPQEVKDLCEMTFGQAEVAVRSDAALEDGWQASHAGEFCTVLGVSTGQLAQALDDVADSMPGHVGDGILVQRMVQQPRFVGVASTHRIADGAPWYCIEWAEHDTASVTGGRATGRQICVARQDASGAAVVEGGPEGLALALVREVERVVGTFPLEIEFVLSGTVEGSLQAYLLQMRPLAAALRWVEVEGRPARGRLPSLAFLQRPDPVPDVAGTRTVLSLMADWNPAELIGAHPRPLALSLFNSLIAEGVWWKARAHLGYAAAPTPRIALLRVLRGRPFVDVRRSANSLLPAGLPQQIRQYLVDDWMDLLSEEPALHDKVEFRIFRTVRDFGRPSPSGAGLLSEAHAQWHAALGVLTSRFMEVGTGSALSSWSAAVSGLACDDLRGWGERRLLRRCREGALAFAVIARLAFAGEAQLRTAVLREALTPDRALALRAAARSSSVRARDDVTKFNHLRPGTFDITQPAWSGYFGDEGRLGAGSAPRRTFALESRESRALEMLLGEAGLHLPAAQWIAFTQESASAREWSKFVFSRHLSEALEKIADQMHAVGLEREHASWLTLEQLWHGIDLSPHNRASYWRRCAERARGVHMQEARLITGPVLCGPRDRDIADSLGALPNFVGNRRICGPLMVLEDPAPRILKGLRGAVVLVSKADPGFDWLFDQGIAGLITEWGGANSHMAIRCAEFGLSAAIGCGTSVHAHALAARMATIDPVAQSLWFA